MFHQIIIPLIILLLPLYHSSEIESISTLNSYNSRPVIGVLAQPSDFPDLYPSDEYSYIASSYIKFVESSGARAVPIPYDLEREEIKYLFERINGVIIPGGNAALWTSDKNMSDFTLAGQYIIQLAIEANNKGDYFPIWGTCLGYELMMIAVANEDVLNTFNSSNHVLKLEYLNADQTRMFKNLDISLKKYSENMNALYFNHHYGITPENFVSNSFLNDLFFISSISYTDNGTAFVASIEGHYYPFYGVQFHLEKNAFEWHKEINASHTPESIKISQQLGNFFINEARKNYHTFDSESEADSYSIYNYNPVPMDNTFMECYFFEGD